MPNAMGGQMTRGLWRLAVVFVAVAAPRISEAGIGDPVPAPFTKHLFSIPGVYSSTGLCTVIACTNATSGSLNVGVEWFRKDGVSLGVSTVAIASGATATFGSNSTAALTMDALVPADDLLVLGAARVLATTSKGVICNAFVMDYANNPPNQLMQLLVTGPTKQSAK
jgi:hypothetical protein